MSNNQNRINHNALNNILISKNPITFTRQTNVNKYDSSIVQQSNVNNQNVLRNIEFSRQSISNIKRTESKNIIHHRRKKVVSHRASPDNNVFNTISGVPHWTYKSKRRKHIPTKKYNTKLKCFFSGSKRNYKYIKQKN